MRYPKYRASKCTRVFKDALNEEIARLNKEVKRLEDLREQEDSDYQKQQLDRLIAETESIRGTLLGHKMRVM